MKSRLFWILLGFDALICVVILVNFFLGIANGSISSFNIGIWIAIWAALAIIMGGSLWLKKLGHTVWGIILLLFLAIPGLIYAFFIIWFIVSGTSWN